MVGGKAGGEHTPSQHVAFPGQWINRHSALGAWKGGVMQPKYEIGDMVYLASTTTERKTLPCPDCLGKKTWHVRSPAGSVFTAPCPRCSSRHQSNDCLSLDYVAHEPRIEVLTIGSVRTDTAQDPRRRVSYMCSETGVGSGSVYNECDLFETKSEAQSAADLLAQDRNQAPGHFIDTYNRRVEFSDYQLGPAVAKEEKGKNALLEWKIRDLKDAVIACETMSEIRALTEEWT